MRQATRIYNAAFERAKKQTDMRNAWSQFAESFVSTQSEHAMCYFATLTTQYKLTLPSARRAVERFAAIVKRECYLCRLVWFAELYECKDGYHLHALVSSNACRTDLNKFWALASKANETHSKQIASDNEANVCHGVRARKVAENRSSFSKLKPGGKGGRYASKYVAKGGSGVDYDIIL
jgi:hypothetical protein